MLFSNIGRFCFKFLRFIYAPCFDPQITNRIRSKTASRPSKQPSFIISCPNWDQPPQIRLLCCTNIAIKIDALSYTSSSQKKLLRHDLDHVHRYYYQLDAWTFAAAAAPLSFLGPFGCFDSQLLGLPWESNLQSERGACLKFLPVSFHGQSIDSMIERSISRESSRRLRRKKKTGNRFESSFVGKAEPRAEGVEKKW